MIAALGAIADRKELLAEVFPPGQSFDPVPLAQVQADPSAPPPSGPWYCGAFLVRICQMGEWREVIVDDLLPARGSPPAPIFLHSPCVNEFWCSLIEKAYAKYVLLESPDHWPILLYPSSLTRVL